MQSPDSHDSGIHVEYTRPSKPVNKLAKRFTPTPVRDESPKRKLPPGWERHEGTHIEQSGGHYIVQIQKQFVLLIDSIVMVLSDNSCLLSCIATFSFL